MNQKIRAFKAYIRRLLTRQEKLSLTSLMKNFAVALEKYKFTPYIFPLIEPYKRELDKLLEDYKREKKSHRIPGSHKRMRKETAKKFFSILERLGAIIPKWMSAIPENLDSNKFGAWREKTSKSEFKCITDVAKNLSQIQSLKKDLKEMGNAVANTAENKRLKKLVATSIEQEFTGNEDDLKIGAPEKKNP